MKTFWKITFVVLMATYVACFVTVFSMYWWPDMPTSPRPAEGRIHPLNNHGHYTYMNESEYRLQTMIWRILPACFVGVALIYLLVDPFDQKAARRKYGSPPPGFR